MSSQYLTSGASQDVVPCSSSADASMSAESPCVRGEGIDVESDKRLSRQIAEECLSSEMTIS